MYHVNGNILSSDKADFILQLVRRDKDANYIAIKWTVYEDTKIRNQYVSNKTWKSIKGHIFFGKIIMGHSIF